MGNVAPATVIRKQSPEVQRSFSLSGNSHTVIVMLTYRTSGIQLQTYLTKYRMEKIKIVRLSWYV